MTGRRDGTYSGRARRSRPDAPERQRAVSPARLVAYDVLRDVVDRDAYANLALPARIREARLDRRDAALATELTAGTLRNQGTYDRIIELAAGRPLQSIDGRTLNVLRLGAHQILRMRVADHAAVNESVELQRKVANRAASGFVNGVLRTIGRSSIVEWEARLVEAAETPDEALAVTTSHPEWVIRALRDALRSEGRAEELEELLRADNAAPRVSLALLPEAGMDPATLVELASEGDETRGALHVSGPSPIGLELDGGDPAHLARDLDLPPGTLRVQDQGSQLAALALVSATPARADERWLDLCAGPGGKTAVLAAEAALQGARLRANEVSDHRAELVREAVAATPGVVDVVSYDGREDAAFGGVGALFDRILVDAPCSGLGALRRRPEARWRKRPSDLPELISLQEELLESAARHLSPGGVLAYVTCSPHLPETAFTLKRLLRKHPELRALDTPRVLGAVARQPLDLPADRPFAQLWPHRHGTDAMFIALLRRADEGPSEPHTLEG